MKYIFKLIILFSSLGCYSVDDHRIARVIDGDTVVLDDSTRVRLAYIDCPELSQSWGKEAKMFTESLVLHSMIRVATIDTDIYHRKVAILYIGSLNINRELVVNGLAWTYKGMSTDELYSTELRARAQHIGLWADKKPIPPFLYRINHKIN